MVPKIPTITPEVFQIGGAGLTDPQDAAVYLVVIDDQAALIDAGCGRSVDRLLANAGACGVAPAAIRRLLLTHCHYDHAGGVAEVKARLNLRVVMHALDAPYVENGDPVVTAAAWYGAEFNPFRADETLNVACQDLRIGGRPIEAIHIPGHSPGSLVYRMTSCGQKVLFGQDIHGPLHSSLKSDAADYRRSLQKLLDLNADILCEGHFGIFRGRDRVKAFIRQYL
jgi:glyoxylase-like metal-dependent hydrolase (beta-lactamase superfamily II)